MRQVILTNMLMRRRQTGGAAVARTGLTAEPSLAETGAAGHGASVSLWAAHLPRHLLVTPLGRVLLAASDTGLAGLWFEGQRHGPLAAWRGLGHQPAHPRHALLQAAAAQLQDYFAGRRPGFDLPLDLSHGTPFQRQVWQALRNIPPGHTASYAELASRVGAPQAARAVGAAVGRNPVSIVVPCHRVLGAGGALTGYAGGLDRKRALLALEGAAI
jgi:methylated-DNA-[protein]-cysteine S-methyltransferase